MRFLKHPDLDAVIEVPDSAVPIYRQSNWVPLTDQEVADLQKSRQEKRRAAEAGMGQAVNPTPPPQDQLEREQPTPAPVRRKSGSSSKENS